MERINLIANGAPWAITDEMMETIIAVAQREGEDPQALATRLGRPLANARTVTVQDGVAVIPFDGPVFPKANLLTQVSGAHSLQMVAQDFQAAIDAESVQNILLKFETAPGGVAGGINEFADIIRNSPKPVTAYVGIMAASAHYWLASAASQVVIDATAQVGNIGIVTKRVMNKQTGVVEIVSSRAPDKRPDMSTPEGRAVIQAEVNAIEDVFISAVAQGRGLTPEDIAAYRGRMLTGVEAVAAGFADKLGSFESALAGLAGGTMGVQPMTATKDNTAAAQVPQITRAYLDENHQELVAAIRQEGTDAALADIDTKLGAARIDGATAERERILSVEAQLMPGHEALISALKADGHTTGPEAAVQVLAAEKKGNADRLTQHRADAPPPLSDAGSAGDDADSGEKRDFMSLVAAEVEAGKTRAQAIRTIAQLHPDLHTAWIHEQNQRKSA